VSNDWLPRVLEESRTRGFLGPNAIEPHFTHSLGFALCWEEIKPAPPTSFLDLGSGGGLPGLFLLDRWRCRAVFTDSMVKRAKFLEEVLEWEGAPDNGTVITGRVEETARIPELVEVFDLVTARSFGPPAVTAECGAQFLRIGGVLIVSEPPDDSDATRWNAAKLEELGLVAQGRIRRGAAYQVLVKTQSTPNEYPRGIGTPRKRPLF
jgi:16S rRNA (guanine527-N7)-methyltransferase